MSVVEGLPEELERVRQIKRLGLAVSGVVLTAGTAAAFTAGMRPPQEVLWTVESVAAAVPLGLGALKITLGECSLMLKPACLHLNNCLGT